VQRLIDGTHAAPARLDAKKKSLTATEQLAPEVQILRARFIGRRDELDAKRLVFIDESGSHVAMTREWARSPRGHRAPGLAPRNRGCITTMIGALALDGVRTLMTVEGGTDLAVFRTFVEHFLVPNLRPGDIVLLDNLGAHKDREIRRLVEAAGATLRYLPPYSPELNPIELCWSKLKALLKAFAPRSRESLDRAIALALELISSADAAAWFAHCGYGVHFK
jgi:transposase